MAAASKSKCDMCGGGGKLHIKNERSKCRHQIECPECEGTGEAVLRGTMPDLQGTSGEKQAHLDRLLLATGSRSMVHAIECLNDLARNARTVELCEKNMTKKEVTKSLIKLIHCQCQMAAVLIRLMAERDSQEHSEGDDE